MKKNNFIAPGAYVGGEVCLGDNVNIWYNAVVRGDSGAVYIGSNVNIQDNSTVHTGMGHVVHVGDGVSIGHNAVVHGCTIGENTMVGMGCIIMNGASVGKNCIIGAGALVTEGMQIPDNSVAFGNPAKVRREITQEEVEHNRANAAHYLNLMREAQESM